MPTKDQCPLYPCSSKEKEEIRKELGIKESILKEDIDAIIEWFYKQPHLAEAPIDRDYVEMILIASKGSREKTKRKIDHFYKQRSLAPELINTRKEVLLDPDVELWTFYRQAAMLKLYNGKRISIYKISDPDPRTFSNEETYRNTIMLGDLRCKFDYMLGDIWIFDLQNVTIGHILRVNVNLIQKFASILQDGVGFKMYEVHVIHAPAVTQFIFSLFKQVVKPKIFERFMFHENIEELHKYVPVAYLPKDYGGEEPSLDEFREMYNKELRKDGVRDYLIECCKQVSNEKLRQGDFYEEYLVGTFKKLEVD